MNFDQIDYLENGNERQKIACHLLKKYKVMSKLSAYDPVLVGTIPIEIDIAGSDLDILCCWENKPDFIAQVTSLFENEQNFKIYERSIANQESVVAGFILENVELEIFGQQVPVRQQPGYRHMVIEARLLKEKGPEFRQQVIALKEQGYKTEPAFGLLLGLKNDPYQELLDYEHTTISR